MMMELRVNTHPSIYLPIYPTINTVVLLVSPSKVSGVAKPLSGGDIQSMNGEKCTLSRQATSFGGCP